MRRIVFACAALFAFLLSGDAKAQSSAASCVPFTSFPLSLNLGQAPSGAGGESVRCANTKFMTAINELAQQRMRPNGLATLNGLGKLEASQMPADLDVSGASFDRSAILGAKFPRADSSGLTTMFGANTPANGTWVTGDASLKCEPILGPFHAEGTDLTRCQSARYFTSTGDENRGEYGTVLNMRSNAGFPTACQRNKFYPEFGTCLNDGGKMYRVKEKNGAATYFGVTAASGSGPTGTGDTIVDGNVTWRYEPNYAPGNGGKTNLALMTYQEANAGSMWTGAFAHQIATGGPKKSAFTLELDLNNYWGDYTQGVSGPTASALQIFLGGPFRSSKAIGIGQYNQPATGQTSLVNGIELCCATLVRDNTILDLTSSTNGYMNQGAHSGSAFTDGSSSAISFNSYGGAGIGFRHAGTSGVGLKLEGTYTGFQVQGLNWNVNPVGVLTTPYAIETAPSVPSSATSPCTAGQRAWDANFEYRCVAANTWKRASLSSW